MTGVYLLLTFLFEINLMPQDDRYESRMLVTAAGVGVQCSLNEGGVTVEEGSLGQMMLRFFLNFNC